MCSSHILERMKIHVQKERQIKWNYEEREEKEIKAAG
jgi:hypothetical protein